MWKEARAAFVGGVKKKVDVRTLIGIVLTIIITAVVNEVDRTFLFPLWAKIALYSFMPVIATMISVDSTNVQTLANRLMDILKTKDDPIQKLNDIEDVISVACKAWTATNTKILEDFNNGEPKAINVYNILKDTRLNVAQKLDAISKAIVEKPPPNSETPTNP